MLGMAGGVQGEIRDAVEVVPTMGAEHLGAVGTQCVWVGAGGAVDLVRHLGLRSGGEGRFRGTDVQAR